MPDGYPQTSVVWCDFDGEHVRVNTMRGFAKERNMRRDPRVTLLCYDPREPLRYRVQIAWGMERASSTTTDRIDHARPDRKEHQLRHSPASSSSPSRSTGSARAKA
jgi:Pyridoxamine 5'-phosphate oxidase